MRLTSFERHALVAIAAVAFAVTTSARALEQTENFDKTVPFPSGGTLEVNNFSGVVHITGGTGKDVVIKAVRRADREKLDHIKLDVQTSGSRVVIEANKRDSGWDDHKDNVVETDFEIQVPASARVKLHAFSSDLDVKGVSGQLDLYAFSGDIELDAAAAGQAPSLSAETFSGNITVRLADSAKGNVNFNSFSGRFTTDVPVSLTSSGGRRRSTVTGALPAGTGSPLNFKTFSGDVRIRK
jgi:DUF4097 and DUF4098 domain-containing protein YvlB